MLVFIRHFFAYLTFPLNFIPRRFTDDFFDENNLYFTINGQPVVLKSTLMKEHAFSSTVIYNVCKFISKTRQAKHTMVSVEAVLRINMHLVLILGLGKNLSYH